MKRPFLQTIRECLATRRDRWRSCDELMKFVVVMALLAVLMFLLAWMNT